MSARQADRRTLEAWLKERSISEVECMVSDIAGIPRGKILPTEKFLNIYEGGLLRLPESVFGQTVTGDVAESTIISTTEPDVVLVPDASSIRTVPWYTEPTAQVICDAMSHDGEPVMLAPRHVLRQVLQLYAARGWTPVVAPELEFYLAKPNTDPDYPLEPPTGRSGRPESGRQSYGIDVVNEFDPLFEDMYDFCDSQGIEVDTLTHESGVAQVEINFEHGDALALADQVFLFKRTLRHAALKHGIYATFMAKPYEEEPGSAMHIHQNILSTEDGRNLFADPQTGENTALFLNHIAGLQDFLPAAMPLLAPYVNSYRRVQKFYSAPINTHWGIENRTVGLRVPHSAGAARRIENRVPGADANPYLAFAASLACGYLGMTLEMTPTAQMDGDAYHSPAVPLPRHLLDSLELMNARTELHDILGAEFLKLFTDVKHEEHEAFQQVISPWEREHLLLNV